MGFSETEYLNERNGSSGQGRAWTVCFGFWELRTSMHYSRDDWGASRRISSIQSIDSSASLQRSSCMNSFATQLPIAKVVHFLPCFPTTHSSPGYSLSQHNSHMSNHRSRKLKTHLTSAPLPSFGLTACRRGATLGIRTMASVAT